MTSRRTLLKTGAGLTVGAALAWQPALAAQPGSSDVWSAEGVRADTEDEFLDLEVTLVLPHQRRDMVRMAESAGVRARPVRAKPGDALVTDLTGGTKPSGHAVTLPTVRRVRKTGRTKTSRRSGRPPRRR